MKRWMPVLLMATLAVLALSVMGSVQVAYADPPDGRGKPEWAGQPGGPHNQGQGVSPQQANGPVAIVKGWVSNVNLVSGSVTGSFNVTPPEGGAAVQVNVSADTLCKAPGRGNAGRPSNAQCANIMNGIYVVVHGTAGSPVEARRIQLVPGRTFHCVGEVVDDPDSATDSITVACRSNGTTFNRTFTILADTRFRPEGTTWDDINDGDMVTIVGQHMWGQPLRAKAIVKHTDDD